MHHAALPFFLVALILPSPAQDPKPSAPPAATAAAESAATDPNDSRVAKGREVVEAFFGAKFPREFAVTIAEDRKEFDAYLQKEYGWPESQCWMVATGVAKGLALLDPAKWKSDACEHDGTDEAHVQGIVTHELVHVFHGQHNKTADFTGMDDLGWFVEGLAVYASGQLDREHKGKDAEALAKNAGPKDLANAWSGKYRYAVCGSLVRYVDATYGRKKTTELLAAVTPREFFELLDSDETALLAAWRKDVQEHAGKKS